MLIIKIETDNAAFQGYKGYEIARILRALADDYMRVLATSKRLQDENGQTVGRAHFTDTDVTKENNHSLPL